MLRVVFQYRHSCSVLNKTKKTQFESLYEKDLTMKFSRSLQLDYLHSTST